MPRTITAQVHKDAIKRTSRFFDASVKDILTELLQNARRANAKQIRIRLTDSEVIMIDDGDGIADPQTLLSFGQSQWSGDRAGIEDAAGMGFFSLSTCGAMVSSRTKDQDIGWTVNIPKEAFSQEIPIQVNPFEGPVGTRISFPITNDTKVTSWTIKELVRYFPVPVTITDGTEIHEYKQGDFLAEATYVKEFEFGRIGLYYGPYHYGRRDSINFYGLVNSARLPEISDALHINRITAKVDIEKTCGLQFILPARKDFQKNEAWNELQRKIMLTFYEFMATLQEHQLKFQTVDAARNAGFNVRDALPLLREFEPVPKNEAGQTKTLIGVNISDDAIIIEDLNDVYDIEGSADHHHIAHANSLLEKPLSLYEANPHFKGYAWYDAIPSVDNVIYTFDANSTDPKITDLDRILHDIHDEVGLKVIQDFLATDRIELSTISVNLYGRNEKDLPTRLARLRTNLIIGKSEDGYADDAIIFVDKSFGHNPTVHDTVEFLMNCYFVYSDDSDSDTYHTQYDQYQTYAYQVVRNSLLTSNEAAIATISEIVRQKMLHLTNMHSTVTITISAADQKQADALKAFSREISVKIDKAA